MERGIWRHPSSDLIGSGGGTVGLGVGARDMGGGD